MTPPGFFLVFEGGDGVGKSTQVALAAERLRSPEGGSHLVVQTREPGGTPLGVELRAALQHGEHVDHRAEALLYAADRAHHVATVVRPALERGAIVVQDRFIDSSIVYQGVARGLGEEIEHISLWAAEGLLPDLTVVLDSPVDARRLGDQLDRLERETGAMAEAIRHGFLERAGFDPARYAVIDATGTVEDVGARVRVAVEDALNSVAPR